jgi:hypothetical protein
VKLNVNNILGQEVMQVLNQTMEAGIHNIVFDASNHKAVCTSVTLKAGII